jgi:hypothetical protein
MDSTQTQFGPILPGMDAFGAPHLAYDERAEGTPTWTGDPSAVPLPGRVESAPTERSEEELDRAIFGALITP